MTRAILVAGAIVSVALSALIIAWRVLTGYAGGPISTDQHQVVVEIPKGATREAVVELLAARGLVQNPQLFSLYLDVFRRPAEMHPGEYALSAVMTPAEIVDAIDRQRVVTYTVAIPPSFRADRIAALLAKEGLGDAAALEEAVVDRDLALELQLPAPADRLEGYLFPDVYAIPRGLSPAQLFGRFVEQYRRAVTRELVAEARAQDIGEHELITLASLIEVDDLAPGERSLVSGVYHNRLRAGMPLENPGSVAYGLGKTIGELSQADLRADHPWNTFVRTGLPPTPIASPGIDSIAAAARPSKTDALYFAPRGDSTHVFCPDEECHRIALERWRKEQERRRKAGAP